MESSTLITTLLEQKENLCLEFKSYWYWQEEKKTKIQQGWNEFLIDFIALFNTYNGKDSRYIIFGYDEKTKQKNSYFEVKDNGNKLNIDNIDNLKNSLIKKLSSSCSYDKEQEELSDFIDFDVMIIDKKDLLLCTLHKAPFYLTLSRDIKGFKENVIPIRKLDSQDQPKNCICNENDIKRLKDITLANKEDILKKEKISIERIVNAFLIKHSPSAELSLIEEQRKKSDIYFELFTINSEISPPNTFIYITSFTNQVKTIKYLCEEYKEKLEESVNLFILVDERNRNNGLIDLARIESLFTKQVQDFKGKIQVFKIEDFSREKIYEQELSEEIFFAGNLPTKDYISPFIKVGDTPYSRSEDFLNNWLKKDNSPILVIKGIGGLGKTTVAKQFIYNSNKINKKNKIDYKVKFLFISSHDIIDKVMNKTGSINNLFDFYEILAEENNVTKKFNEESFALSADNGNIIIVIDGIDEIIAKKRNDFKINELLKSIISKYFGNFNKTKIIFTCRTSFWSNDLIDTDKITEIKLLPFTEDLANQYFYKVFSGEKKKIDKALKMAQNFQDKDKDSYIPYMLDMIRELLITTDDSFLDKSFESDLLINKLSIDFIIGKVCDREIQKLNNFSIDEQLNVFIEMSLVYSGTLTTPQLENILKETKNEQNTVKFQAHPLLKSNDSTLTFKYDFFELYFKELALFRFFSTEMKTDKSNIDALNTKIIQILIENINYYNDFTINIISRINDKDELKDYISLLLWDVIENPEHKVIKDKKEKILSSLFILLLSLINKSKNARTDLLKDIFKKDDYIENLHLINLHSTNEKITFNFNDLKFNNCHIENFENFLSCDFNKNTHFSNTTFLPSLGSEDSQSSLTQKNINTTNCRHEALKKYFKNIDNTNNSKSQEVDEFLRRLIRFFWNGVSFYNERQEKVNNKFRNNNDNFLLKKTIKHGLLKEFRATKKIQRQGKQYKISEEYEGLRRILGENQTCTEYEQLKQRIIDDY